MPSEELARIIGWLHGLRYQPPGVEEIGDQVAALARSVAESTGASVRMTRGEQMQVLFSGRNAVVATGRFRRMALEQVPAWGEQVARDVIGRLL